MLKFFLLAVALSLSAMPAPSKADPTCTVRDKWGGCGDVNDIPKIRCPQGHTCPSKVADASVAVVLSSNSALDVAARTNIASSVGASTGVKIEFKDDNCSPTGAKQVASQILASKEVLAVVGHECRSVVPDVAKMYDGKVVFVDLTGSSAKGPTTFHQVAGDALASAVGALAKNPVLSRCENRPNSAGKDEFFAWGKDGKKTVESEPQYCPVVPFSSSDLASVSGKRLTAAAGVPATPELQTFHSAVWAAAVAVSAAKGGSGKATPAAVSKILTSSTFESGVSRFRYAADNLARPQVVGVVATEKTKFAEQASAKGWDSCKKLSCEVAKSCVPNSMSCEPRRLCDYTCN